MSNMMKKVMYKKANRWTDCLPCDCFEVMANGKRPISAMECALFLDNPNVHDTGKERGWIVAEVVA